MMLTGQNGILTQAQNAKTQSIIGKQKEAIELACSTVMMNEYMGDTTDSFEAIENELKNIGYNATVAEGYYGITVTIDDNNYIVDDEGKVSLGSDSDLTKIYVGIYTDDGKETLAFSNNYKDLESGGTLESDFGIQDITGEKFTYTYLPSWTKYGITSVKILNKIVPENMECWFYGLKYLTDFEGADKINALNVTSLSRCFYICCSLEQIPVELFKSCGNVTDFSWCFAKCSKLQEIPSNLFDKCLNVTDFSYCFFHCNSLSGNAIQLWTRGNNSEKNEFEGIPDGYDCFGGDEGLENYSDIPSYWKKIPK